MIFTAKKKWYLQMDTLKLYTGWRSCFWENMRLLWLTWMHKLGSLLHTCSIRVCRCAIRHILFGGLGPLLVMEILWFDLPTVSSGKQDGLISKLEEHFSVLYTRSSYNKGRLICVFLLETAWKFSKFWETIWIQGLQI